MNKNIDLLKAEFSEYADRMGEIRRLSSPRISKRDSADGYSARLSDNFTRIGELAAINRRMLDDELYPILESDEPLDEAVAEALEELDDMLLAVTGEDEEFENLDLPVTSLITERLFRDAEANDDICLRIRRMDAQMDVCYSLMNMTERLISRTSHSSYREKGIEIGKSFIAMLDKEFFLSISDPECRKIVLTDSRFSIVFYDGDENRETNQQSIDILLQMLNIAEDEFYHKNVPGFDWKYFQYRILEAFVQNTESNNEDGFSEDQLKLICDMGEKLDALIKSDPDYFGEVQGAGFIDVAIARCRYLAGRMQFSDYMDYLISEYDTRKKDDVSLDGIYFNVLLPLEILCQIDADKINARNMDLVKTIYNGLNAYAFLVPSGGTMIAMLEYFPGLIRRFADLPGAISLDSFLLNFLAAIHPPTFVHSKMVGQISERLCCHLIDSEPELFVGILGTSNTEDVLNSREELQEFTYKSAICHDFGKIFIIDTILVYGRRLLDFEFDLIKSHPETGSELLSSHRSTSEYADIALFHHKWYDDSKGYPFDKKSADSRYKTIIDIVQCADCLDAATDTVGRSYNRGKTVEDYMEELKEGSGTRYAPWLYDLFCRPEVREDIEYLLTDGRKRNYRETYSLLRNVQETV